MNPSYSKTAAYLRKSRADGEESVEEVLEKHEHIIRDYMLTNHNAFWPTVKKCAAVALLTRNWSLVRLAYSSFMARRELIETAIQHYK